MFKCEHFVKSFVLGKYWCSSLFTVGINLIVFVELQGRVCLYKGLHIFKAGFAWNTGIFSDWDVLYQVTSPVSNVPLRTGDDLPAAVAAASAVSSAVATVVNARLPHGTKAGRRPCLLLTISARTRHKLPLTRTGVCRPTAVLGNSRGGHMQYNNHSA